MNRHNYTFGDMLSVLPQMNRIKQIRANPNPSDIPKGHKKQENIWDQSHTVPAEAPHLINVPWK